MSAWIDVDSAADFGPGQRRDVEVDGAGILIVNVDGQYFAIENVCTHDGNALSGGDLDGDRIICPRHGARFCLRTGQALTPPAYEPVATFPVRVDQGRVQVRDDRWD